MNKSQKRLTFLLLVLIFLGTLFFAVSYPGSNIASTHFISTMPENTSNTTTGSRYNEDSHEPSQSSDFVVVASIPYWDQERAFKSFRENSDVIDVISVFWYYLSADGEIIQYEYARDDQSLIDFAHENDVLVFGTVTNLPETGDWDFGRIERIIQDPDRRARHINDLLKLTQSKNFDGISIDYENIPESSIGLFADFIEDAAAVFHAEKKLLKVDIEPRALTYSGTQNEWRRIGDAIDQFSVMTFNEHWDESDPGPVASTDWFSRTLLSTLALGVDASKLYAGIPFYGYDWHEHGDGVIHTADGVEYTDVKRILEEYETVVQFNDDFAAPHFEYQNADERHIVWFENAKSVEAKLIRMHEHALGGVTIWRLGGEDPRIWNVIRNQLRQ